MRSTRRGITVACAVLCLLLALPASAVSSEPDAGPVAARPGVAPPGLVREVYDLLLDRFVYPLSPGQLLGPAAEAALVHASTAKGGEWPRPELGFEDARDADWDTFAVWFETLARLALPEIEATTLEQVAIRAMTAAVSESHTRYMTAAQYQERLARNRGDARYIGIGARLRGPVPIVVEVYDDSPAARAGMRPGDVIVAVNGVSTEGASLEVTIGQLRGDVGSPVEVLVRRRGVDQPFALALVRDEVRIALVRSSLLDGKIGYLQLRGFASPSVAEEVSDVLTGFDNAGIRGLVVDLRGNPGGRLDVGVQLISRFVREGVVYRQSNRTGQRRSVGPVGGYWEHKGRIAVLVDGGSASMSEIFASALQEAGAARIVGTKTAGSVAAAQMVALSDGSAVQVTVLEITSGRGATLNGVGVEPDLIVDLNDEDLQSGRDTQLEAAIAEVGGTSGRVDGWPRWLAGIETETAAAA